MIGQLANNQLRRRMRRTTCDGRDARDYRHRSQRQTVSRRRVVRAFVLSRDASGFSALPAAGQPVPESPFHVSPSCALLASSGVCHTNALTARSHGESAEIMMPALLGTLAIPPLCGIAGCSPSRATPLPTPPSRISR
ncbi:hypothetical protein J6590_055013 [Homalodisca vitripennis]|nr:hypothetical protein J6590_055013 [Homalodisca vitripennis]